MDIKYIQIPSAPTDGSVENIGKGIITKKFSQCKTSHTVAISGWIKNIRL